MLFVFALDPPYPPPPPPQTSSGEYVNAPYLGVNYMTLVPIFFLKYCTHSFREEPTALQSVLLGASARSAVGISLLPVTVVKARYEVSIKPK